MEHHSGLLYACVGGLALATAATATLLHMVAKERRQHAKRTEVLKRDMRRMTFKMERLELENNSLFEQIKNAQKRLSILETSFLGSCSNSVNTPTTTLSDQDLLLKFHLSTKLDKSVTAPGFPQTLGASAPAQLAGITKQSPRTPTSAIKFPKQCPTPLSGVPVDFYGSEEGTSREEAVRAVHDIVWCTPEERAIRQEEIEKALADQQPALVLFRELFVSVEQLGEEKDKHLFTKEFGTRLHDVLKAMYTN